MKHRAIGRRCGDQDDQDEAQPQRKMEYPAEQYADEHAGRNQADPEHHGEPEELAQVHLQGRKSGAIILLLQRSRMDPLTFLNEVGRARADQTAKKAGINPGYFNQICYGHRRASVRTAEKLVKASQGKMSLLGILQHQVKRRNGRVVVAVV